MLDDAAWAEEAGLSTVWIPQVPDEFDAMTAAALIAQATARIEIGTAVVPAAAAPPGRPAPAVAVDAAGRRGPASRSASARRTTGSSRTCSGCPTSARRRSPPTTSTCSTRRWPAPAPVDVENEQLHDPQPDGRHRPAAHAGAARRARPGDAAARRVAHRRHDPVARRREGDRVATSRRDLRRRGAEARPAGAAHRRRRAGLPVPAERGRRGQGPGQPRALRGDGVAQLPAPARPGRRHRRRPTSSPPATRTTIREAPARRSPTPASPTSRSASLPIGDGRDELLASSRRTREFVARSH